MWELFAFSETARVWNGGANGSNQASLRPAQQVYAGGLPCAGTWHLPCTQSVGLPIGESLAQSIARSVARQSVRSWSLIRQRIRAAQPFLLHYGKRSLQDAMPELPLRGGPGGRAAPQQKRAAPWLAPQAEAHSESACEHVRAGRHNETGMEDPKIRTHTHGIAHGDCVKAFKNVCTCACPCMYVLRARSN